MVRDPADGRVSFCDMLADSDVVSRAAASQPFCEDDRLSAVSDANSRHDDGAVCEACRQPPVDIGLMQKAHQHVRRVTFQFASQSKIRSNVGETTTIQRCDGDTGFVEFSCEWSCISQADDANLPTVFLQTNCDSNERIFCAADIKFGNAERYAQIMSMAVVHFGFFWVVGRSGSTMGNQLISCPPHFVSKTRAMVTPDLDDIAAWQYELPDDLIASRPTLRRDDSRLMVVCRDSGRIEHRQMRDLPDLLSPRDRLIFNNTKVLPARLFGFRTSTKGKWEGLFLDEPQPGQWRITGQTRGRLLPAETLTLVPATGQAADESLELELISQSEDGSWLVRPGRSASTVELLEEFGTLPLPPYIGRKVADEDDRNRYQTVFAHEPGAIAAPTAGLHFTPELLDHCRQKNVQTSEVTLHVGIGTFRPVSGNRLSEHRMHSEWCRVTQSSADEINATKAAQGNVVAVGTTSVRTLEAAARNADLSAWQGATDIFIKPGFDFRVVDQLLTNFHLPGSTLIVLVAALAGYDLTMEAYRQAVAERYRFYSYGDAMLIL